MNRLHPQPPGSPDLFPSQRHHSAEGFSGAATGAQRATEAAAHTVDSPLAACSLGGEADLRSQKSEVRGQSSNLQPSTFIRASVLAAALGLCKPSVHQRAVREGWAWRKAGNRFEYQPPAEIAALCPAVSSQPSAVSVKFVAQNEPMRAKALLRAEAVRRSEASGDAQAIRSMRAEHPDFSISARSLTRWKLKARAGLDALGDQKRGRVGAKPFSDLLSPEQLLRGRAVTHEKGSSARAYRELMDDPRLSGRARSLLTRKATKSYVPPSIKTALRIAPLTTSLLQGPRAARLAGRWTPGDYSQLKAGDVFTSDDMTSNVICWVEWPNAAGFRVGQAQILPVMDVRTLRWLNVRVIMREGGQYSADDIWGLFGDTFDQFGLPANGFLLEGGHWQSNRVRGHKTELSDDERIGGLESLGLKVWRSYDPRSKGMLEGAFNQLQFEMDAFPGYAGRDQRKELPEAVKKQLALCDPNLKRGPSHHPREFFPHISQLAQHVEQVMAKANLDRQDGQILRGQSPLELWAEHAPTLVSIPDSAKWMYRSAFSQRKVTKNGVLVTQGSGPKQDAYYYDNPEILVPVQGMEVSVYWNDRNPDADAAIVLNGRFLGMAKRVQPLNRFSATDAQLAADAQRKNAAMRYARTEARTIQPELARHHRNLIPVDAGASRIGTEIAAATDRAAEQDRTKAANSRRVRATELTPEDLEAAVSPQRSAVSTDEFSADEVTALFASDGRADLPVGLDTEEQPTEQPF